MKNVGTASLTVYEANALLEVDMEPGFWAALIRLIGYPELVWDPSALTIRYPDYVPFKELAREWIEGIEQGIYDVRECARCAEYFDLNRTEGIFGDAENLEQYICMPCAEAMTAREYYERFIEG